MAALINIGLNTSKTMICTALGFAFSVPAISQKNFKAAEDFFLNFNSTQALHSIQGTFTTYTALGSDWIRKIDHPYEIGLATTTAFIFSVANEALKVTPFIKNAPKIRVLVAAACTGGALGAGHLFLDPSLTANKTAEVAYRYFIAAATVTVGLIILRSTLKIIDKTCSGAIWVTTHAQPLSCPTGPKEEEPVVEGIYSPPTTPMSTTPMTRRPKTPSTPSQSNPTTPPKTHEHYLRSTPNRMQQAAPKPQPLTFNTPENSPEGSESEEGSGSEMGEE